MSHLNNAGAAIRFALLLVPLSACSGEGGVTFTRQSQTSCIDTDIEELSTNLEALADRQICGEAVITFVDSEVYLVTSVGQTDPRTSANRQIYLNPAHPIVRSGDLHTGDLVSYTGHLTVPDACYEIDRSKLITDEIATETYCPIPPPPAILELTQFQVLNRSALHDRCIEVSAEALYTNPLPYREQIICATGTLRVIGDLANLPTIVLTPDEYEASQVFDINLYPGLTLDNLQTLGIDDGDRIIVRGRFGLMEECWSSYLNGEGCIVVRAPMWIAGSSAELID